MQAADFTSPRQPPRNATTAHSTQRKPIEVTSPKHDARDVKTTPFTSRAQAAAAHDAASTTTGVTTVAARSHRAGVKQNKQLGGNDTV
jgi:hypothetical protein